ncbi:hypothetical protein AWC26_12900 [Mycobacterium shimoidei]|nr:hypothetical protein BHQ16_00305 [Mycobacterium shimoidei]ORW79816.1 hypothetical protein AWC26_12900 [Mycobacterium shimoidei]
MSSGSPAGLSDTAGLGEIDCGCGLCDTGLDDDCGPHADKAHIAIQTVTVVAALMVTTTLLVN